MAYGDKATHIPLMAMVTDGDMKTISDTGVYTKAAAKKWMEKNNIKGDVIFARPLFHMSAMTRLVIVEQKPTVVRAARKRKPLKVAPAETEGVGTSDGGQAQLECMSDGTQGNT